MAEFLDPLQSWVAARPMLAFLLGIALFSMVSGLCFRLLIAWPVNRRLDRLIELLERRPPVS